MVGSLVPRALKANSQAKRASSMLVWMESKVTPRRLLSLRA
jgi:hypothetical protein